MQILLKIVASLIIFVGVIAVFVGMSEADSFGITKVVGGGLFMSLGIAIFILNK